MGVVEAPVSEPYRKPEAVTNAEPMEPESSSEEEEDDSEEPIMTSVSRPTANEERVIYEPLADSSTSFIKVEPKSPVKSSTSGESSVGSPAVIQLGDSPIRERMANNIPPRRVKGANSPTTNDSIQEQLNLLRDVESESDGKSNSHYNSAYMTRLSIQSLLIPLHTLPSHKFTSPPLAYLHPLPYPTSPSPPLAYLSILSLQIPFCPLVCLSGP